MSDGPAFLRRARLTIVRPKPDPATGIGAFFSLERDNAIEVDASTDKPSLRIQAEIRKSLGSTPNACTLTVTNLAESTRDALSADASLVAILEVGYGDAELRRIFTGDVFHVGHELDGPHVTTKLQAHDGGRAYAHARILKSYRAGTSYLTAIRETAQALGLTLPPAIESHPGINRAATAGISLAGKASAELTRLLEPFGLGWSIQDGGLVVLAESNIRPGETILIDEQAGMIGSPTWGQPSKKRKKPPLSVKCLLFPELAPGGRVRVKSRAAAGDFKVKDVQHDLDTHGGDWMTSIQCQEAG